MTLSVFTIRDTATRLIVISSCRYTQDMSRQCRRRNLQGNGAKTTGSRSDKHSIFNAVARIRQWLTYIELIESRVELFASVYLLALVRVHISLQLKWSTRNTVCIVLHFYNSITSQETRCCPPYRRPDNILHEPSVLVNKQTWLMQRFKSLKTVEM